MRGLRHCRARGWQVLSDWKKLKNGWRELEMQRFTWRVGGHRVARGKGKLRACHCQKVTENFSASGHSFSRLSRFK